LLRQDEEAILADMERCINEFHDNSKWALGWLVGWNHVWHAHTPPAGVRAQHRATSAAAGPPLASAARTTGPCAAQPHDAPAGKQLLAGRQRVYVRAGTPHARVFVRRGAGTRCSACRWARRRRRRCVTR
jgi:hypothetical protein